MGVQGYNNGSTHNIKQAQNKHETYGGRVNSSWVYE